MQPAIRIDENSKRTFLNTRNVLSLAVPAALYFAAAKVGLSLAFATKQVTALWPPSGIAVATFLLLGHRAWPGVFVGAFVVNAMSNESALVAAGIAVGNTLGPMLGAVLLRRAKFDGAMARLRDVISLFVLGAMVAMIVTATNGVANLALGNIVPWSSYFSVWWVWWMGDAMGVLIFAPVLLTWTTNPRIQWRGWRLVEFVVLHLFVFLASNVFLATDLAYPIAYIVFPFIIWAAVRFGQRETATVVLIIAGVAVWASIHNRGPFSTGNLDQRLIYLEMFMAVASLAALSLGAVTEERWRAEKALQRAKDELEIRVVERTADLVKTNSELAKKNEEVEAFVYIVSHDLRAPLVNIQGFSKELQTSCNELDEKLLSANLPAKIAMEVVSILKEDIPLSLRFITASATKFQRLIEALLTLSRTGRQDYRRDEVDILTVVASTVDSLQQSILNHGARLEVSPSLPRAIGDVTALGQVFSNLINNSLNYLSKDRPGVIEVGGRREDQSLHYWVKDNGVGIPESAQRRLFQVFQRFHPEMTPGEGMGLAIVKRVVERHGGRIWAESVEGVGTTFHMSLPDVARGPGDNHGSRT